MIDHNTRQLYIKYENKLKEIFYKRRDVNIKNSEN